MLAVWCHDLRGDEPREYLSLHLSSPDHNVAQYYCGQECQSEAPAGETPTTVTTAFSKLRINPCTLTIDVHDTTFAKTIGKLWHRDSESGASEVYTYQPFGVAGSCESEVAQAGTSNIDLSQTPFIVKSAFKLVGASPAGTTTFDKTRQIVDITGVGFCGANAPEKWNYWSKRTEVQWALELELRPQAKQHVAQG